jgi:hypothetical protein
MTRLQTLVNNVTVMRPDAPGADDGEQLNLGIVDGRGLVAFPGVVDAHQHRGIYNPLGEDAVTGGEGLLQAVIRVDAPRPLLPYRKLPLDGTALADLSGGAA